MLLIKQFSIQGKLKSCQKKIEQDENFKISRCIVSIFLFCLGDPATPHLEHFRPRLSLNLHFFYKPRREISIDHDKAKSAFLFVYLCEDKFVSMFRS